MTNVKDFFTGNFLKAEDLKGGEICEIMAIGEVSEINTPEGRVKSVLNYEVRIGEHTKTFTPNMTNGNIMLEAWGEDDEKWVGKKFQIELLDTIVFGKKKKTIVIKPIDVKVK